MAPGSRLRQIGWAVALSICITGFVALTFRVNAVKSEVRLAERRIIALEQEKQILETEFETRANQQQLANWNKVEFGYAAPLAEQYLENERELAQLGLARDAGAPSPIRVARAATPEESGFPAMVSPMTGKTVAEEEPAHDRARSDDTGRSATRSAARSLAERLAVNGGFGAQVAE
ncbi:hypothetical protein GRI44_01735 [Altererythrobacter confluentis]|uniref:Uncharacterized protein n=1 Tax=Allopontixanthobacter confluentis TaxID=1849021 RepID=A0A6L7GDB8_9SPHN|nr:hypothetical protein [Allopontixanthobacter confluentis]MXP13476.1 hypothetical protein [Allopontixanthobacter confluentis]